MKGTLVGSSTDNGRAGMTPQDFINIVSETSSLSLDEFFHMHLHQGYTAKPDDMFRVLAKMHAMGMGVDDIIPTVDAAFDFRAERGMVSRWTVPDHERGYSFKKWDMEELVNTKIHYMLQSSAESCDLAFSLIRQGGDRLFLKPILNGFAITGYYQHQHDLNLCRTASGQLRAVDDFLLLPKNQTIARMLCDSAIFWEDLEAVRYVASIPEYRKHLDDKFLAGRVKALNNSLRAKGTRDTDLSLLNDLSEPTLEDYARLLSTSKSMVSDFGSVNQIMAKVMPLFNAKLLSMAPAEFVYMLMTQKDMGIKTSNIFIAKMAESGIPTKLGFLLANKGRFFVTEFPQAELTETEIVQLCFEHKAKRGYLGMLYSVSLDVIAAHRHGQKLLNLMYEFIPSNEIAQRLDTKGRAKQFKNDLGV